MAQDYQPRTFSQKARTGPGENLLKYFHTCTDVQCAILCPNVRNAQSGRPPFAEKTKHSWQNNQCAFLLFVCLGTLQSCSSATGRCERKARWAIKYHAPAAS